MNTVAVAPKNGRNGAQATVRILVGLVLALLMGVGGWVVHRGEDTRCVLDHHLVDPNPHPAIQESIAAIKEDVREIRADIKLLLRRTP